MRFTPPTGHLQKLGAPVTEKKKDIIIRPADGGRIVVLDKKEYKKELNHSIEDKKKYDKLKGDCENKWKAMLTKKAQEKGILNIKEAKYLVPEGTKDPHYIPGP